MSIYVEMGPKEVGHSLCINKSLPSEIIFAQTKCRFVILILVLQDLKFPFEDCSGYSEILVFRRMKP